MIDENKILEEIKLLEKILENLGFYIRYTNIIEDELDTIISTMYYVTDCYTISLHNRMVGNCSLFSTAHDSCVITSTLNKNLIPEELINQLALLGYENEGEDWIEYEREII